MSARKTGTLAPQQVDVKKVRRVDLLPNPHNPRMLFDREPLLVLRQSIEKVGILVPLTVYWGVKEKKYIILDGQRRWMAASELKLREVPINVVAEPNLVQNIVTMFQIHKLREDWELMPTALKLDVLMKELQERNDNKLATLTGLDAAVVTRCKKLLSYSRKFQDTMLDPDPDKRIRADFFIELYAIRNDRFVGSLGWFKKDQFTQQMLSRYKSRKGIKAVTDFRTMKQYLSNALRAGKDTEIGKRLKEFAANDSLSLDHLALREAGVTASARKITSSVRALADQIRTMEVEEYFGEEELWEALQQLLSVITKQLRAAEKRI